MADDLTLGVEEEFLLIDATGRLVPRAQATLAAADSPDADIQPEMLGFEVEAATGVCRRIDELIDELEALRRRLIEAARRQGARLVASGTAPHEQQAETPVSPQERYRTIAAHYGPLVYTDGTCGCHVHVGMPDLETTLQVVNHLRPWLPLLLAVSANSPFHGGRDTGYASARYALWARWPSAGPPPYLDSVDQYESVVDGMLGSGAILDRGMIYWDIRPSAHQPTVEIRVHDVAGTAREAALLAVLCRALVHLALDAIEHGRRAEPIPHEVLRANMWRAAHEGFAGRCLDPHSRALRPAGTILDELLGRNMPRLSGGEPRLVRELAQELAERGGGACRQRAAFAPRHSLDDVVGMLAGRTAPPP